MVDVNKPLLIAKYSFSERTDDMGTYHYTIEMSLTSFIATILLVLFSPKLVVATIVISAVATIPNLQEKCCEMCHNVLRWSKDNILDHMDILSGKHSNVGTTSNPSPSHPDFQMEPVSHEQRQRHEHENEDHSSEESESHTYSDALPPSTHTHEGPNNDDRDRLNFRSRISDTH